MSDSPGPEIGLRALIALVRLASDLHGIDTSLEPADEPKDLQEAKAEIARVLEAFEKLNEKAGEQAIELERLRALAHTVQIDLLDKYT